jgi:hypothetical protein
VPAAGLEQPDAGGDPDPVAADSGSGADAGADVAPIDGGSAPAPSPEAASGPDTPKPCAGGSVYCDVSPVGSGCDQGGMYMGRTCQANTTCGQVFVSAAYGYAEGCCMPGDFTSGACIAIAQYASGHKCADNDACLSGQCLNIGIMGGTCY